MSFEILRKTKREYSTRNTQKITYKLEINSNVYFEAVEYSKLAV